MPRTLHESVWQSRRELVAQQSQSGKSVTAFCQEHDLSVSTFYAWKKRTQSAIVATKTQANHRDTTESLPQTPSRMIADVATLPFFQLPLAPRSEPDSPPWVELTLPNGTVVRVPAQQLATVELVLKMCQPSTRRPSTSEGGNHV